MSSYYKLIDSIETPTTINVARKQNGVVTYGHMRLDPGVKYELEDDEILLKSLKTVRVTKRYSEQLVKTLDDLGIPYKDEGTCKSCGGCIKKISYSVVEVVE